MNILLTGGAGKLGKELIPLLEKNNIVYYPSHNELDVSSKFDIDYYFSKLDIPIDICIHSAALINQQEIEDGKSVLDTIKTNVFSTGYLAEHVVSGEIKKLVYISTDYIYDGKEGNYNEESPVYPVSRYGWSKLGGECIIRQLKETDYLIVRCSFSQAPWHKDIAYVNQYSSRETVDIISQKIVNLIDKNAYGTYNIGTERRSVYDYACSIRDKSKHLVPTKLENPIKLENSVKLYIPVDTSTNQDKYKKLMGEID